jgi:hypothetical protein
MNYFRDFEFLTEDSNDTYISTAGDSEHIRNLDRQAIIMLINQIKLCFYRIRCNDLLYNGVSLSSAEMLDLSREMDTLTTAEFNAQMEYKERQRLVHQHQGEDPEADEDEYDYEDD